MTKRAKESNSDPELMANRLAAVGIGGNLVLVAFKLVAGILGNSMAMVSDAIHSLSDVLATFIAWVGTRVARREADESHPYGHERFECLASLALGAILFATACAIGFGGVNAIVSGSYLSFEAPTYVALAGAVVSILVKEAMFHYTYHHAKRMGSDAFVADAWHHRSDALSSVGALVGIGASMAGFPLGDSLAAILIGLFVLKVAWEVVSDAVDKMMDTPCDAEKEASIRQVIASVPGIERIDLLRTRTFGNRIYVDAEVGIDGSLSLHEAHEIAHEAHDQVERAYPDVKHIMIHVNPA